MGYYGLSHHCRLTSSRAHHKILFLEKISKVFFDVACDWVTVESILSLKTWIFNEKSYGEAGKWWGCFCKPTESGLYYFPFCTNKNIIIPPIVKETKECYCTYSKHIPTNKKLRFKNLLEKIKSWIRLEACEMTKKTSVSPPSNVQLVSLAKK